MQVIRWNYCKRLLLLGSNCKEVSYTQLLEQMQPGANMSSVGSMHKGCKQCVHVGLELGSDTRTGASFAKQQMRCRTPWRSMRITASSSCSSRSLRTKVWNGGVSAVESAASSSEARVTGVARARGEMAAMLLRLPCQYAAASLMLSPFFSNVNFMPCTSQVRRFLPVVWLGTCVSSSSAQASVNLDGPKETHVYIE